MLDIIGLKYLGSGRHRDVYLLPSGKNVIKVPSSRDGVASNHREARIRYEKDPWTDKEKVYARCRIIPGTNFLVMEYIDPVISCNNLPKWTNCIDCGQVGYNRKGELKAYDYGF